MIENKEFIKKLIQNGALLVDLREQDEIQSTLKIKSSVNIPMSNIDNNIDFFKKKKSIILFCNKGGRANKVLCKLKDMGFNNIYNGGGYKDINSILSNNL